MPHVCFFNLNIHFVDFLYLKTVCNELKDKKKVKKKEKCLIKYEWKSLWIASAGNL